MADDTRITDLERTLRTDPASIAFAQLGEEYRRAGRFDDAIEVCRRGLTRHPDYTSARVTLGRALLAKGLRDDARVELEAAAAEDPSHIAASRALSEWRGAAPRQLPPGWEQHALRELEGWLASVTDARSARQGAQVPGAVPQDPAVQK